MKNFVDVLDGLKTARQKDVNRKQNIDQAWIVFRRSPGHVLRTLKADIRNAVYRASPELHTMLERAVFTVESYIDSDAHQKASVKIAFVPRSAQAAHRAQETMMFNIVVDHITSLGLHPLVNDICVNSLQQRF